MLTTGILSLNVHDSLTFDGTEICLNPDLFATTEHAGGGGSSQKANVAGIGAASIGSGNSAGTSNISSAGLSVGDTIEIRVWDPLPKEAGRGNSPASTTGSRKRFQQAPTLPTPTMNMNIQGNAALGRDSNSTMGSEGGTVEPGGVIPSLRPRTAFYPLSSDQSANDGQKSMTSSPKSASSSNKSSSDLNEEGTKAKASPNESKSAQFPTKTVVTPISNSSSFNASTTTPIAANNTMNLPEIYNQQRLPPVFPRNRFGTTDDSNSHTLSASKPPKPHAMLHRRAASTAAAIPTPQRSPKQQQRMGTRHSRDISDMTADTTFQLDKIINDDMGNHQPDTLDMAMDDGVATVSSQNEALLQQIASTHRLRLSFVLKVMDKTLTCFKGNSRTQISVLRQVADLYNLSMYDLVTVHKIEPRDEEEVLKAVSADFVVVTIKDQFISRGDMLLFQTKLIGTWIYEGQRLIEPTRKIKAHAREIRHGNFSAKSGIVTEKTNITFRSRSARIVWLVQLSSEMWEYSSPYERQYEPESVCEIYFDQWIRFLYKLFKKWKELEVTHSLTVIFFSRTFLSKGVKSELDCHDVYGRKFEDHYKPVIENETCIDWDSLIVRIKEEFTKYPLEVGWNLSDRKPSCASQGNLLEAINVILNLMQYHYLDRDLHRTGQSIVIVSPGCGVFEVDKGLAGITYQRMMDNGIGSDMLSLGLPPLHIAPFFLYNNEYHTVETQGADASEVYYEVPHWMHLSFVIYDRPEEKRVYLSGLENKTTRVQRGHWLDAYDIGANGFLRPQEVEESTLDSQPLTPKKPNISSFSAAGNMAATPGKAKVVQEQGQARQLISGRKFTDILEACRPRMLGATMPSPLLSLLKDFESKNEGDNENDAKESSAEKKDYRLREWGTIDFNDLSLHTRLKASIGNSPSPMIRRTIRNQSMINSDRSVNSSNDDGSGPSSFGSNSMLSVHGTSFDRVFWDYYEAPSVPARAFQMQRSTSIDYDELGKNVVIDGGPGTTDDSSTMSDNISKGSLGGDSESTKSKIDRHADYLRKIMDSYDTMVCQPPEEDNDDMLEKNQWNESTILLTEPELARAMKAGVQRQRGKDGESSGGLQAALSQYKVDEQGSVIQERPSNFLKRRASGGHYLTAANKTTSFNSERRRAASPLMSFRPQQQERPGTPKLFSSLITATNDPPNILRPGQQRTLAIHRPLPNKAIVGRERSSSLGGQSAKFSHISGSSVNRFMIEPSRQTGLPASRSPPSNVGFLSNTPRGAIKLYSQSPPKVASTQERIFSSKTLAQSPPLSGNSSDNVLSVSPPKSSNLLRERSGSPNSRKVSKDRASSPGMGTRLRDRSVSTKPGGRDSPLNSVKTPIASRRKKAFNPFRQSDEDEVLAKRSHNRRRWSHVYPEGEVEFKRHAGPIWNSLTSPAILPLSVDHFPTQQELKDEKSFQFSFYTVTLGGIENKNYEKHADLLREMVRQRVTQDFQIVTDAAIADSFKRATESQREGRNAGKLQSKTSRRVEKYTRAMPSTEQDSSGGKKNHYLSMGHKIQVMNYDPGSDTIEIVLYNRTSAHNDRENVHTYKFLLFSKVTQQYTTSIQTFKKYSEPYKWNRVDNLICGEADRTMDVGMRFRRVMFGLIPERFKSPSDEDEYVSKFKNLLAYLEKLRDKDDSKSNLNVEIITSKTEKDKKKQDFTKSRQDMTDTMIRFPVQLLRGKKDPFEWIEVAISSTFDTSTSFRIIFNWLVASSAKVETQVQILHRRFKNFGLKFISFPQTTVSWDLFIHALAAPTFITIRDPKKADAVDETLSKLDFVYDGITITSPQFLECIENSDEYRFPHYRSGRVKAIPAPQFVHRSGAIFIRKLTDREGKAILVGIENYRHSSEENKFREIAKSVIKSVLDSIKTRPLEKVVEEKEEIQSSEKDQQ